MLHDLRIAVRGLRTSPTLAAAAILTLAVGIGANTAIFSLVRGVLIKPLPYPAPERLAVVWERNIPRARDRNVVSPANYLAWRDRTQAFANLAAFVPDPDTLTGAGDPEELRSLASTANLFELLGASPLLGRTFLPEEDTPGAERVVVLSSELWQRRFGGTPGIIGRTLLLDGRPGLVVGVMPPGFEVMDQSYDVYDPLRLGPDDAVPRGRYLTVLGRLREGVSIEQAQADMATVSRQLTVEFPDFNTGWTTNVVPLKEQIVGESRAALLTLLGGVGLVLLIACANVAGLLLARTLERQREMAVRAALGASRARLVRQLLIEGAVLVAAGGSLGWLGATAIVNGLPALAGDAWTLPRLRELTLDRPVLAFTAGICTIATLVFGLLPAAGVVAPDLSRALKSGSRSATGAHGRTRAALVVAETAVALLLLIGAGLLTRSLLNLTGVDPGFRPESVVTFRVSLPSTRYAEPHQTTAFFSELTTRLGTLPAVRSAGGISFLPLTGPGAATSFRVEGRPAPAAGESPVADVRWVTGDYFGTMGIPLLAGRLFDRRDTGERARIAVINETFAKQFWPDDPSQALGARLAINWDEGVVDEVIGIVSDVRHATLEADVRPMVYWPHDRVPLGFMTMVVRSTGPIEALVPALSAQVQSLDPDVPVVDVRPLTEVVARATARPRLLAWLIGAFAAIATVLVGIGVYGAIAQSVAQRTQEIGIRIALGATPQQILSMVVGQGLRLGAAGLVLGLAAGAAAAKSLTALLYGVAPADPVVFAGTCGIVAVTVLLAAYVPARRAVRTDPATSLRLD